MLDVQSSRGGCVPCTLADRSAGAQAPCFWRRPCCEVVSRMRLATEGRKAVGQLLLRDHTMCIIAAAIRRVFEFYLPHIGDFFLVDSV